MRAVTDRQAQVLDFVRTSIRTRGYPPTLREIGAHMGIRSTNGVNDHLRALERKGYLTRDETKSRGLRVVFDESELPSVEHVEPRLILDAKTIDRIHRLATINKVGVESLIRRLVAAEENRLLDGLCPLPPDEQSAEAAQ